MASRHLSHLKRVNNQCLRLEIKIVERLLYRNKNQHRREKEFQKLKKIHRLAKRVSESPVIETINKLLKQMIKHATSKSDFDMTGTNLTEVLVEFRSFAELIKHAISFCQDTYCGIARQLAMAWFVPFTLTIAATISRIWVCLRFIFLKVDKIDGAVREMAQRLDIVRDHLVTSTVVCKDSQLTMSAPVLQATIGSSDVMFDEMPSTAIVWSGDQHSEEDTPTRVDIGEPIAIDWHIDSDDGEERKITYNQESLVSKKRKGDELMPASKLKRQLSKRGSKSIQRHRIKQKGELTIVSVDGRSKAVECLPETQNNVDLDSSTMDDIFSVLD